MPLQHQRLPAGVPARALVLLSGGLDSATVLGILNDSPQCKRIECISINYGQRHFDTEAVCAGMIADHYKVQHAVLDLGDVARQIFYKSPLIKTSGEAVPVGEDPNRGVVAPTYVPRRNTVLLAIASAIAEQRGLSALAYGAHKTDSAYPDCGIEYAIAMKHLLIVGSPVKCSPMNLYFPIIHFTKRDVVELAAELQVPVALTHSCYQGKRPACGVCDTCQIRIAAFKAAGYIDPIEYEIDIDWGDCNLFPGEDGLVDYDDDDEPCEPYQNDITDA